MRTYYPKINSSLPGRNSKVILIWALFFLLSGAAHSDLRALRLEKFLERYCPGSPLVGKGQEMVYWADKYGLDYRLYLAISGVESGFGRKFPRKSHNLTGICNGKTRFASISQNIQFTNMTIGAKKWYRKYRKTRKIEDLVYVYKGVPPYERYLRNLRLTLDLIDSISIAEETKPIKAAALPKTHPTLILALNQIRFDRFASRSLSSVDLE